MCPGAPSLLACSSAAAARRWGAATPWGVRPQLAAAAPAGDGQRDRRRVELPGDARARRSRTAICASRHPPRRSWTRRPLVQQVGVDLPLLRTGPYLLPNPFEGLAATDLERVAGRRSCPSSRPYSASFLRARRGARGATPGTRCWLGSTRPAGRQLAAARSPTPRDPARDSGSKRLPLSRASQSREPR
jgi:hypothetical protein